MTEAKRKKGESFESFLRRFKKKIQQSGILIHSRKIRFYERPKSRNRRREAALRKMEMLKEKEYLRKIGKLRDDEGSMRRI